MEGISDVEYLQDVKHGSHDGLVAKAITGYADTPGTGRYVLVCIKCGSTIEDPWMGIPFGEGHVVRYADAWKQKIIPDCEEAKRINEIRQIMQS